MTVRPGIATTPPSAPPAQQSRESDRQDPPPPDAVESRQSTRPESRRQSRLRREPAPARGRSQTGAAEGAIERSSRNTELREADVGLHCMIDPGTSRRASNPPPE